MSWMPVANRADPQTFGQAMTERGHAYNAWLTHARFCEDGCTFRSVRNTDQEVTDAWPSAGMLEVLVTSCAWGADLWTTFQAADTVLRLWPADKLVR